MLCVFSFSYFLQTTCPRCSSRHSTPLFPHFPGKPPYFTQKPPLIKVNPSKYPPFPPQNPPKPYFLSPKTPKNPPFSLKNPPNPYFFRFSILFHPKFRIFETFNAGRFNSLLFPIFPDFPEIIKFPALPYFSPISWSKTHENPNFPPYTPPFPRKPLSFSQKPQFSTPLFLICTTIFQIFFITCILLFPTTSLLYICITCPIFLNF